MRTRRAVAWAAVAAAALAVSGCLYGVPVEVSGPADRPILTIGARSTSLYTRDMAGFDSLTIQDESALRDDPQRASEDSRDAYLRTLVWRIDRPPTCSGGAPT